MAFCGESNVKISLSPGIGSVSGAAGTTVAVGATVHSGGEQVDTTDQ